MAACCHCKAAAGLIGRRVFWTGFILVADVGVVTLDGSLDLGDAEFITKGATFFAATVFFLVLEEDIFKVSQRWDAENNNNNNNNNRLSSIGGKWWDNVMIRFYNRLKCIN